MNSEFIVKKIKGALKPGGMVVVREHRPVTD